MLPEYFVHNSEEPFKIEKFKQPRNMYQAWKNKPIGGLWLAPFTPSHPHSISPWHGWCLANRFRLRSNNFLYTIGHQSSLFMINSKNDYEWLVVNYPLCYKNVYENKGPECFINYEQLIQDWDGVYLSWEGLTNTSDLDILTSWDVPSLLILNPKILVFKATLSEDEMLTFL